MSGANGDLMKAGSEQRHERVRFFKRLAIGAADPKFTAKLQALIDEYEAPTPRGWRPQVETPTTPASQNSQAE